MNRYSKSVAAIVGALASVLVTFNIEISDELQGTIVTLVTALVVYLAPRNA